MMRDSACDVSLVCSVGEDQVARLGDRECELDRLEVAHLADEEHIGVGPQGRFEERR